MKVACNAGNDEVVAMSFFLQDGTEKTCGQDDVTDETLIRKDQELGNNAKIIGCDGYVANGTNKITGI